MKKIYHLPLRSNIYPRFSKIISDRHLDLLSMPCILFSKEDIIRKILVDL